jgi:uncharacterized protein YfiM (DUF2279 family)
MQQWNFLESLAEKCFPPALQEEKERLISAQNLAIWKIRDFWIPSTAGSSWIFSRVENAPEGSAHSVIVYQSNI